MTNKIGSFQNVLKEAKTQRQLIAKITIVIFGHSITIENLIHVVATENFMIKEKEKDSERRLLKAFYKDWGKFQHAI